MLIIDQGSLDAESYLVITVIYDASVFFTTQIPYHISFQTTTQSQISSLVVRGIWDQEICFLTMEFGGSPPVSSFQNQTSHSSIRRCRIIIEDLGRTCCAVTEAKGKLPD